MKHKLLNQRELVGHSFVSWTDAEPIFLESKFAFDLIATFKNFCLPADHMLQGHAWLSSAPCAMEEGEQGPDL